MGKPKNWIARMRTSVRRPEDKFDEWLVREYGLAWYIGTRSYDSANHRHRDVLEAIDDTAMKLIIDGDMSSHF